MRDVARGPDRDAAGRKDAMQPVGAGLHEAQGWTRRNPGVRSSLFTCPLARRVNRVDLTPAHTYQGLPLVTAAAGAGAAACGIGLPGGNGSPGVPLTACAVGATGFSLRRAG
jgi:hypothetical protein